MLPPAYDVEFLREHEGYVRALARQLVFDEQLAQDIEQQTWLTALEHAPRDPRSPRAWLAQLVRNGKFAPLASELEVRANEETRFELHLRAP